MMIHGNKEILIQTLEARPWANNKVAITKVPTYWLLKISKYVQLVMGIF